MEIQMTIEELEAAQRRSHELLNVNSGVDVEIFDDVRKYAYNLVDDALLEAISHLKEYRKIIYPGPDRDILSPRS
jgi:hypothetical protein